MSITIPIKAIEIDPVNRISIHNLSWQDMEVSVLTQGSISDKVVESLIETVRLHLEGENPEGFGLVPNPSFFVAFELQPEYVKA